MFASHLFTILITPNHFQQTTNLKKVPYIASFLKMLSRLAKSSPVKALTKTPRALPPLAKSTRERISIFWNKPRIDVAESDAAKLKDECDSTREANGRSSSSGKGAEEPMFLLGVCVGLQWAFWLERTKKEREAKIKEVENGRKQETVKSCLCCTGTGIEENDRAL